MSKSKKSAAKKWRESHHSRPGDPPFVQTGTLKRSVTFDKPEAMRRRVGSTMRQDNKGYALWLELGTRKMPARPYLRPGINKLRPQLAAIVAGKA